MNRDNRVAYQSKVLRAGSATTMLRELARQSRTLGATIEVKNNLGVLELSSTSRTNHQ